MPERALFSLLVHNAPQHCLNTPRGGGNASVEKVGRT